MAQKPDIQYVTQFYSYGSEAKVLELKPVREKQKTALPKAAPQQKILIQVDPVAWVGIAVALVMVVLLTVSVQSYLNACAEYELMTEHVITLQNTNLTDTQKYEESYNLDEVREKALALGMIPIEEAEEIIITPVIPEPEAEPGIWENISWFMKGLFA